MKQTLPHHIFHRADELVVEEQMLRLVFWVGSRVKHSTHGAAHCSKMLLPRILQNDRQKNNNPQRVRFPLYQTDSQNSKGLQ